MKKAGLGLVILGVLGFILTHATQDAIIIQMGIQWFNSLSVVPFAVFGLGAVALGVGFAPAIGRSITAAKVKAEITRKEKGTVAAQLALPDSIGPYKPTSIKEQLIKLRDEPGGEGTDDRLLNDLIKQLEAIDRHKVRLWNLIVQNQADYLEQQVGLLDDVEQTICRRCLRVLNRGLVLTNESDNDAVLAGENGRQQYRTLAHKMIEDNRNDLAAVDNFLAGIADIISQQETVTETDLEGYLETLKRALLPATTLELP